MTFQTIPACVDCKHCYNLMDDILPLYACKFHTFEKSDFLYGKIHEVDMLAHEAREDEDFCGREGKDFEQRETPVEVKKMSKWQHFKNFLDLMNF